MTVSEIAHADTRGKGEDHMPTDWAITSTPMRASYSICELALGVPVESSAIHPPIIDLCSPSASHDPRYPGVPVEACADARRIVNDAFHWHSVHFPVATPPDASGVRRPAIDYIDVRLTGEGELLSASSAEVPGRILLGAPWPAECTYRLASLIAHEAIHQGLFVREAVATPVRRGSLGYSPWRRRTRPGRLVWHAFWTFTCQFSLLADAVTRRPAMLHEEPGLLGFIAAMPPRVECCLDSLTQFRVVDPPELDRCGDALHLVRTATGRLAAFPRFSAKLQEEEQTTANDYRAWADQVLSNRKSG